MEFDEHEHQQSKSQRPNIPQHSSSPSISPVLAYLGLSSPSTTHPEETMGQLLTELLHEKWSVRVAAVRKLEKFKERAPLAALLHMLEDEHQAVRAATVRALGKINQEIPLDPLLSMLHDSDWHVRATVLGTVSKYSDRVPIEPLVSALGDLDESVRAAAIAAIGSLGERAPIAPLVAALHDYTWTVREAAALALGNMADRAPIKPLLAAMEDVDRAVRQAAEQSLHQTHPEFFVKKQKQQENVDLPASQEIGSHAKDQPQERLPEDGTARVIDLAAFRDTRTVSTIKPQEQDNASSPGPAIPVELPEHQLLKSNPNKIIWSEQTDDFRSKQSATSMPKQQEQMPVSVLEKRAMAQPDRREHTTRKRSLATPARRIRLPERGLIAAVLIAICLPWLFLSLNQHIHTASTINQWAIATTFQHHDTTGSISTAIWTSAPSAPDTNCVAFADTSGHVEVWDPLTNRRVNTYGPFVKVLALTGTTNHLYIAALTQNGSIQILEDGLTKQVLPLKGSQHTTGSFSPDGTYFSVALNTSGDSTIHTWNIITGKEEPHTYTAQPGMVETIVWPAQGSIVASVSTDNQTNEIEIWNATTGQSILPAQPVPYINTNLAVVAMAWSPDGQRLAYMLADESVSIYNRQSGGGPFTTTPTDPGNGLQNQNALAWSPDGKYLATSQANGEIQIWDASLDANTGTPLGTYQTHNAQITTLAWSPDNSKRIVGGDNTGNIWVLTAM